MQFCKYLRLLLYSQQDSVYLPSVVAFTSYYIDGLAGARRDTGSRPDVRVILSTRPSLIMKSPAKCSLILQCKFSLSIVEQFQSVQQILQQKLQFLTYYRCSYKRLIGFRSFLFFQSILFVLLLIRGTVVSFDKYQKVSCTHERHDGRARNTFSPPV